LGPENKPPVDATIMFTLMDSRSIKPVLEIQLPNTIQSEKPEACYCVNLKDYEIQLESDIQYRWYISITHNPELHSRDTVAGRLIERCADEGVRSEKGPRDATGISFWFSHVKDFGPTPCPASAT
jgi:hypothetical protein